MNEKLYISPSLFYLKNKLHFESNDKAIKINSSNWHKYLEEYGWEKLPHGWKIRLKENASNFKYGILDCGAEGDCLFHCIGEALFDESNVDSHKYEVEELRKFTASKITSDNFDIILENYKCEEESYVFNAAAERFFKAIELVNSGKVRKIFYGNYIRISNKGKVNTAKIVERFAIQNGVNENQFIITIHIISYGRSA